MEKERLIIKSLGIFNTLWGCVLLGFGLMMQGIFFLPLGILYLVAGIGMSPPSSKIRKMYLFGAVPLSALAAFQIVALSRTGTPRGFYTPLETGLVLIAATLLFPIFLNFFCLNLPRIRKAFLEEGSRWPAVRGEDTHLFFSQEERQRIVSAIREAETKTSAEIRVYLERKAKADLMERARKVFEKLGMTRTEKRNGVLIYFSLVNHQFVVLGDRGIHEKVGDDFWNDVVSLMQGYFTQGEFVEGLRAGIARIGEKLKIYFPWEPDDINELPDEVSD